MSPGSWSQVSWRRFNLYKKRETEKDTITHDSTGAAASALIFRLTKFEEKLESS